eukprot:scaffold96871_cov75-Phaeocystis_antarctica.AAC.2
MERPEAGCMWNVGAVAPRDPGRNTGPRAAPHDTLLHVVSAAAPLPGRPGRGPAGARARGLRSSE